VRMELFCAELPMTDVTAARRHRAAFVDKDGTLIEDVPYNVDTAKLRFMPQALQGLRLLARGGYLIVLITNQPGIAFGLFDQAALRGVELELRRRLASWGIVLSGFYACPHAPAELPGRACTCRKPEAGLLLQAAQDLSIDLERSWMIGDILDDVEAGRRAGCRSVLLDVGHETVWRRSPLRVPAFCARDLLAAARGIAARDGIVSALG
jgi:D-glycero-D-manno-heptose 1,7-bisphosphate phosphatase